MSERGIEGVNNVNNGVFHSGDRHITVNDAVNNP